MRKKIDTTELKVGMRVVDTGLSWVEHPYLYARDCTVKTREQIDAILAEGYTEVFIEAESDPRSPKQRHESSEEAFQKALDLSSKEHRTQLKERPKIPFREELGVAKKLYSESLMLVHECVKDARMGTQIDIGSSENAVDNLMKSVMRNSDALISLTKLRTYDEYTYTHSINVSVFTLGFANYLNLPEETVKALGVAALLHDMGKSRISDAILNKPGKLTDEEFTEIKKHPSKGVELLIGQKSVSKEILRGVEEHHEKFNGKGYPKGLKAEEISLFASIISLADVYDALTSKRVYKPGIQPNKAMGTIFNMRGQDFFPQHVDRFINFLGIYPIGSLVQLSSGFFALVSSPNPGNPLKPNVKVILDRQQRPCISEDIDLSSGIADGLEELKIIKTLDPKDYRIDPAQHLL